MVRQLVSGAARACRRSPWLQLGRLRAPAALIPRVSTRSTSATYRPSRLIQPTAAHLDHCIYPRHNWWLSRPDHGILRWRCLVPLLITDYRLSDMRGDALAAAVKLHMRV